MLFLALALQAASANELTIRAAIDVDATGHITDCRVVESEAPAKVNEAACRTIATKGRTKPEMKKGKAVASTREVKIRWRPESDVPQPKSTATPIIGR